jgi:hypothetical protein
MTRIPFSGAEYRGICCSVSMAKTTHEVWLVTFRRYGDIMPQATLITGYTLIVPVPVVFGPEWVVISDIFLLRFGLIRSSMRYMVADVVAADLLCGR